ncbi:hypothetical protein C2G38_2267605 [Gigaspora rosea]|uniref:BTB domain-containing protein n=1 Tax=Gigaspora rosea TaxID=44941 RepID=A0A397W4Y2_9GLOM|nr:hypothetical protein C2G38_2267605 [Gigaspora rosea]
MDEEFEDFNPGEEYAIRIKNILTEYPEGSQILREILQNTDDAQSSEQVFILDDNTYPSEKLFDPNLSRFQRPALLSVNNSIFEEDDFKSLLSLANSGKMDKCDKIGVMGIGFNSIFHITDICSFISGSSYVLIDPHGRGYCNKPKGQRGTKANFVKNNMKMKYPDQFEPFSVALNNNPLEGYYKGTIFRYPLRTDKDVKDSKIAEKKYSIEQISFYEIKKGSREREFIYEIKMINAKEILEKRNLLAYNIKNKQESEIIYQMEFCQESTQNATKIESKSSKWQVVNYIANKNDEKYKEFNVNARDCKFIPVVRLAARIDDVSKNEGRLYCFLPLPDIEDDFSISINGCFAALDDILRRKGLWNKYLFEHVIPIAWKIFLNEIKNYVPSEEIYTLWPIPKNENSHGLETRHCLWANLLQNVINQLDDDMQVFRGPSGYLSIKNGKSLRIYYENERLNDIDYHERLLLLGYILQVKNVYKLHRLPLLLIENETFTAFNSRNCGESYYVASKEEHSLIEEKFKEKIVNNNIGEEVSSILRNHAKNNEDINIEILSEAEFAKIFNKNIMFHNIKRSESSDDPDEVIIEENKKEWLNKIWTHFQQTNRNLANFLDVHLLPIDTIDNDGYVTLRKLGARQKCLCYPSQNSIFHDIVPILSLLGSIFINKDFEEFLRNRKLKNYVIEIDDISSVLSSLEENHSFPSNLVEINLSSPQDENLCGPIISPSTFLETHTSEDICFLLESVLENNKIYEKSHSLLEYINDNYEKENFADNNLWIKIKTEAWIPIKDSREHYRFLKPSDCRDRLQEAFQHSEMPIVDCLITNDNLCQFFEWDKKPDITVILGKLGQLFIRIKSQTNLTKWVQVSEHNKENYSQLLEKLGVKQKLDALDYSEILQSLNIQNDNVMEILEHLSKEDINLEGVLIPNMNGVMKAYIDIFFNDINKNNKELIEKHREILTHHKITSELAKKLRIKNFKEDYILKNKMVVFDAEILTCKFSNALEGFDQDIMVFQEFLKNADDSAICNVDCNKKPNKIGKDGLGFISCYNLTDLPQLISRDRIVLFDPQKKFFPDNKCGSIFYFDDYRKEDKNHIINMFEDQFEPYLKLNTNMFKLDFNGKEFGGTLFRLPLRIAESNISNKINSIDSIKVSLNAIKDDIASYLIFLRNIKSVKVYEKTSPESEKLLWKAEVKENDSNRKFFGQVSQEFQLAIQLTELAEEDFYSEKNIKWLICSDSVSKNNSIPSNTWGVVAISISDIYNKLYTKGRYFSYLPLEWTTGLSINLHSNNWALTPGRNKFDWNHREKLYSILEKVFPPIHVKLLTEYVKYIAKEQENADWQFISEFWPILKNKESLEYKYIQEVLKLICEGTHKIFWSSSEGGSYVNFRQNCFIDKNTPIIINKFLNESGYHTVLLDTEYLKEFEKLGFTPQKVNPKFVREILKSKRFVLDLSDLELSWSLLSYILEDELYEELMGITLVPLFGNGFGQFGKTYYIAPFEQFELFPKTGANHFISIDDLIDKGLKEKFLNKKFLEATNIKSFSELTIRDFLIEELNNDPELDWDPNSHVIPNQMWLNKIWGYILNNSLKFYESFPLLEIYNPSNPNQHKLVSLKNATSKPLLVYSNNINNIDIVRILANLGIRFTNHQYNKELENYILNLEPYNILSIIQKYQCEENLLDNNEAKEILCKYFCENLILHNEDNMDEDNIEEHLPHNEDEISILKELHIWPTHTIESENIVYKSISDSNTYLVPTPFKFPPLNKRRAYYYNIKYPNMLLESLDAKKQSKLNYIKDVISDITSIPEQMQNEYLQFLIDIFSDNENLDEIKNYIKDLKIIPNKTFGLDRARDLFDLDIELFKSIYEDSNRVLLIDLQNNQKFKEILNEFGFKNYITPEIFIECAKDIQTNFEQYQNDSSKLEKILKSADMAINYFYKNQSEQKFSKDMLDKLSKIKFIPTSKKFLESYLHSYEGGEIQSFENLCHSEHKSLAWTQLSIFNDDPNPEVLDNYSSLGLPTTTKTICHLKIIQQTVSESDKWKEIDNNGEKLFKAIKDIYEELLKRLDNNPDEFTFCFPKDDPLFLNSIDPFDSKSWQKKTVDPYLLKYEKLLIFAGAILFPHWKPKSTDTNIFMSNSQQLSKSFIEFLSQGNQIPFNNVLFYIGHEKQEIYANSSILVCVVPCFRKIFSNQNTKFEQSYEDIEPNSFKVLLKWLYGENFSQAIKIVGNNELAQVFGDLLLLSDKFELELLKDLIEDNLVNYINENLSFNTFKVVKYLADKHKLQVKGTNEILGGYNPVGWDNSNGSTFINCDDSFIFLLKNDNSQDSILSRVITTESAICCDTELGPVFGDTDLMLIDNFNQDGGCCSLKSYYENHIRENNEEEYFSVEEFEIFQIYK